MQKYINDLITNASVHRISDSNNSNKIVDSFSFIGLKTNVNHENSVV